jgi:hypothetical protein
MKRAPVRIFLGTRKGTYVVEESAGNRRRWKVGPLSHPGSDVFHVVPDPRHPGTVYANVNSGFWGPMVLRSRNWGRTWSEVATPLLPRRKDRKPDFGEGTDSPSLPLTNLWHLEPGSPKEPRTLFLGVDPHALFRSDDEGQSWSPVGGINDHPTRSQWTPGFGGPCLHTILIDPDDARRMFVGLSAAGMFRTEDGGEHWTPVNRHVATPYLPQKFPEVGQCVHHVVADAGRRDLFYRQDHGGIYVSRDGMDSWVRIKKGLPDDFGFAVASPAASPGRSYFVPLNSRTRLTMSGGFQVMEWSEERRSWRPLMGPQTFPGDFGIHREGLACDSLDPPGIFAGTTTGQLFLSPDAGKSWQQVPYQFPGIHSVTVSSPRGS